ncbi:MAG: ATP-dependent Lhr-like helicase [Candidatus Endobugula sp.]|jgi:ATP-dependent Lhr-like helicase
MKVNLSIAESWFQSKGWNAFDFQKEAWNAYLEGKSGLLNAPTGSGKTYALWLAVVMEHLQSQQKSTGLQVIWVTPLRALAKDIQRAMQEVCEDLETGWEVGLRTGDTSQKERTRQSKSMPAALVTTPESIHVLLAQKGSDKVFQNVKAIIIDEWHELLGGKRGVQMELALSRIKHISSNPLKIWAISATIGNLNEAAQVLLGNDFSKAKIIKAKIDKKIIVETIMPDSVNDLPWSGHLGIHMLPKMLPILDQNTSTLLFTNVRSQTEIWYHKMIEKVPDLAGQMAMHHGSLDNEVRQWVEDALHAGKLKCVVCTSSLDLGVDFRPVDAVIQAGSPKGIARFFQRAGRSGHRPGATSKIYFLPTHSLELIESAVLQEAIDELQFESRTPLTRSFDVLVQYLVTLAVGPGFYQESLFDEIKSTNAYKDITIEEWQWCLEFITTGGNSLSAYDEYAKVEIEADGKFKVNNRRTAMRHRLSMGTIVSDPAIKVKYVTGGFIGTVEETFIAKLNVGDAFWFAGRNLELVRFKDMIAQVKKSKKKNSLVPSWGGGRASFSSLISDKIRKKLGEAADGKLNGPEMQKLKPLLDKQSRLSLIPKENQLLIEQFKSKEGTHIYVYPFEGKYVHEVMAALMAYRISVSQPITFSIASNDYGFELLTDQDIEVNEYLELDLFSTDHLLEDIYASINSTEMATRKFRDIASIAGLIFQGYPGKGITYKHLQASSSMIFKVFKDYDPENLLLKQANEEVLTLQFEKDRLNKALDRINKQEIMVKRIVKPTPLSFPIMVDRLRDRFTTEKLSDRVARMQVQYSD